MLPAAMTALWDKITGISCDEWHEQNDGPSILCNHMEMTQFLQQAVILPCRDKLVHLPALAQRLKAAVLICAVSDIHLRKVLLLSSVNEYFAQVDV